MKCNVCGYEDDKNFSICPYCGEPVTSISNNVNNYSNSDANYNGIVVQNQNTQNPVPVIRNLPTTQPKGFVKTVNGFKITHQIDDGDFYRRYVAINVLAILCFIVIFIVMLTNDSFDSFDGLTGIIFLGIFIFLPLSSLLNHIYSSFMNNFIFEVDVNGISVKSPMKQYFISRANLNNCWFENISKMVDKFNYTSFFMSLFLRGRYGRIFRESSRDYANSDLFHNEKEFKRSYNVFIEVDNPIFENDLLTPKDKKCLRFINTGLSFQSASEARFVEQELKRILNISDIPVQSEYDYNKKMGISDRGELKLH